MSTFPNGLLSAMYASESNDRTERKSCGDPGELAGQERWLREKGNCMIPIPGTSAVAFVNKSKRAPGWWSYTLFDEHGKVFGTDAIDFTGLDVDAQQVARVAFLLEVDYGLNAMSERHGR